MAKKNTTNNNGSNTSASATQAPSALTVAKVLLSTMALAPRTTNINGITVNPLDCRNKRAMAIAVASTLCTEYQSKGAAMAKALYATPLCGIGYTTRDGGKALAAGLNDCKGYYKPQASWWQSTQPAAVEAQTASYKAHAQSILQVVKSLQGDVTDEAITYGKVQDLCRKLVGVTPDEKGNYNV